MKLHRFIAMALALLMVAALFSGCQQAATKNNQTEQAKTGDTSTKAPAAEKPKVKTFTAFINDPNVMSGDEWETPVGKKITELTGVKLVVDRPVGADTRQKAGVMVASGDYPDLIWSGEATGEFLAAKAFIPLNDLLDKYGKNIKNAYRPNEIGLLKQKDGKIYYISTQRAGTDNLYPYAGFYIIKDALKQQGWPQIKTLSQYEKVIRDYIKKNPEYNGKPAIGFSLSTEGGRISSLQYGAPRFMAGSPNDGVSIIDFNTYESKNVLTQSFNKVYLQFMHDFWNEGLLDKEIFMQTNEQYQAKISTGRLVGFYDQRWSINNALAALQKQGLDDRMPVAFPVVFDDVKEEHYRGPMNYVSSKGISISVKCKDPEAAFKFIDQMASDEVDKLHYWGIEGVDYTAKDGKMTRTPEQWKQAFDNNYLNKEGIGLFSYLPNRETLNSDEKYDKYADGNWVDPKNLDDYYKMKYTDNEKEVLKAFNIKTFNDYFAPTYPARYEVGWSLRSRLPADDPGKIAIEKALETSTQYIPKIIMTKDQASFDKMYAEYMAQLAKLNLPEVYDKKITQMAKDTSKLYQQN